MGKHGLSKLIIMWNVGGTGAACAGSKEKGSMDNVSGGTGVFGIGEYRVRA